MAPHADDALFELAVLAAAAIVHAGLSISLIAQALTLYTKANTRKRLAPGFWNIFVAIQALLQALAHGYAAARTLDRGLDARIDLLLNSSFWCPTCGHIHYIAH